MNTLTINLIHPKAEKLIYDLVEMNLISIESQNNYPKELINYLDAEMQKKIEEDTAQYSRTDLNIILEDAKKKAKNV